jgi:hypothetical protein
MKQLQLVFAGSLLLLAAGAANALDASGVRYTTMLSSGGPGTIQRAGEDIYNSGYKDQEVLDVAAQSLSEIYLKNPNSADFSQATSWLCKALGNSGDGRYRSLLETVSKANIHRKTRSYCEKAMDGLPKAAAASYQVGSVDLAKYRDGAKVTVSTGAAMPMLAPPPVAAAAPASAKKVDFSLVKEGMSQEEVTDLIGPPTNQTTYMTGKAFQPFNFGARDVQRTKLLYKGVGHIVFSLKSAYNGVYRVVEIVPDPNESGYP